MSIMTRGIEFPLYAWKTIEEFPLIITSQAKHKGKASPSTKESEAENKDDNRRRKFPPCGTCGKTITLKIYVEKRLNVIFARRKVTLKDVAKQSKINLSNSLLNKPISVQIKKLKSFYLLYPKCASQKKKVWNIDIGGTNHMANM